jgi:hypothetical protein
MCNRRTKHANLTDEELLKLADSSRMEEPLVEELCQRLERYTDWAASLSAIETTRHACPECSTALLAVYDGVTNTLTVEKAPAL